MKLILYEVLQVFLMYRPRKQFSTGPRTVETCKMPLNQHGLTFCPCSADKVTLWWKLNWVPTAHFGKISSFSTWVATSSITFSLPVWSLSSNISSTSSFCELSEALPPSWVHLLSPHLPPLQLNSAFWIHLLLCGHARSAWDSFSPVLLIMQCCQIQKSPLAYPPQCPSVHFIVTLQVKAGCPTP